MCRPYLESGFGPGRGLAADVAHDQLHQGDVDAGQDQHIPSSLGCLADSPGSGRCRRRCARRPAVDVSTFCRSGLQRAASAFDNLNAGLATMRLTSTALKQLESPLAGAYCVEHPGCGMHALTQGAVQPHCGGVNGRYPSNPRRSDSQGGKCHRDRGCRPSQHGVSFLEPPVAPRVPGRFAKYIRGLSHARPWTGRSTWHLQMPTVTNGGGDLLLLHRRPCHDLHSP